MFIKRVTLSEFGRLTGTIEFERNRCNVICQDNEYGKTTIMDAVLYALYNFPTSGFTRETMKPKDKYRPWNAPARTPNVFVVELELQEIAGRSYILKADFTRNQPFTLHDADTLQPIPLDGMTFGQRYLRMPLSSFTQAFFLRQDEKEGSQKGQLVGVIEEAAASNRRDTPSSVRQALEALGAPRMTVPAISAEPLLVKNLVKRLEERREELQRKHAELKRKLDEHAREIAASDELDKDIADLGNQISLFEYALLSARAREKQILLTRYNEGKEAQAERTRLLTELEPFAAFDPSKRTEIIRLLGEWKLARQRRDEARTELEGGSASELEVLDSQLKEMPEVAAGLTHDDLESLRQTRAVLADREGQLARETEKLVHLEADMVGRGVPVNRLSELHEADSAISPADREVLFEHGEARLEAQAALTELERNALAFREQAMQAKNRRSSFGNIGTGITVVVVAFMVVGIVLLLTDNKFFGFASIIAAVVLGVLSLLYISGMRAKIAAQELDPALQGEMALSGQTRQIREQLETLETEYHAVLQKLGLTPEKVTELREVEHWKQSAAPWIASRDSIDRLQAELQEARANAGPLVNQLQPGIDLETLDETVVAGLAARLEQYLQARKDHGAAAEKVARLKEQLSSLEQDVIVKDTALAELVQNETTADLPGIEEKTQAYLDGAEKALRLQTLKKEYGAVNAMTEDEADGLQRDLEELAQQQKAMQELLPPDNNETMEIPSRPEELERRLSQLRSDRDAMKERRNRGFRDAEQAVSDWRTHGPELERALSDLDAQIARAEEFDGACQLAHTELKAISEQVYTQWATALNERVNRIVPLINERYNDVALSPDLEISVYSREAARRLETKEIQHLSKGARDQLLLAMRIAIAEYLSAHVGNLPLALDEPFAHWDDQRFVEGMRFLARLSEKHQIIMLSCHSWRYAQLRETAPEVADKVNFSKLVPV